MHYTGCPNSLIGTPCSFRFRPVIFPLFTYFKLKCSKFCRTTANISTIFWHKIHFRSAWLPAQVWPLLQRGQRWQWRLRPVLWPLVRIQQLLLPGLQHQHDHLRLQHLVPGHLRHRGSGSSSSSLLIGLGCFSSNYVRYVISFCNIIWWSSPSLHIFQYENAFKVLRSTRSIH